MYASLFEIARLVKCLAILVPIFVFGTDRNGATYEKLSLHSGHSGTRFIPTVKNEFPLNWKFSTCDWARALRIDRKRFAPTDFNSESRLRAFNQQNLHIGFSKREGGRRQSMQTPELILPYSYFKLQPDHQAASSSLD